MSHHVFGATCETAISSATVRLVYFWKFAQLACLVSVYEYSNKNKDMSHIFVRNPQIYWLYFVRAFVGGHFKHKTLSMKFISILEAGCI